MRPAARSRRGMQQNHTTGRGRKGRSRAAEYRLRHQCRRLPHRNGRGGQRRNAGKNPKRVRRFGPYGRQARQSSKEIFPLRNIRAGHKYTVFIHEDSLYAPHLDYLVYERNMSQYVVFGFHEDSVSIQTGEKEFSVRRTKKSATINSSLWGAIMEEHLLCAGRGNGGHLPVDGRISSASRRVNNFTDDS